MRAEYNQLIKNYPDIVLTNQRAMQDIPYNTDVVNRVLNLSGVSSAVGRVYGKYAFSQAETVFTLLGIDAFENYANSLLNKLKRKYSLEENSMLVSSSVAKILKQNYYKEYFNFIKEDGSTQKVKIAGTFYRPSNSADANLIVMPNDLVRKTFGFEQSEFTDISIMVQNKEEIGFIAEKLQEEFPNAKITLKEDLLREYENIYNFRSGFFLTVFIIAFFTFFIIIYDKLSGPNSAQKREIGILKAIGWRVEDILKAKLYEAILISMSAYTFGMILALLYVYLFKAPYLKAIFLNNYTLLSDYRLMFHIDIQTVVLLFFVSVPLYIAATIIPSWRVATLDADEVMR